MIVPLTVLAAILAGFFAARRLLTLLRFFQQEEYDRRRFAKWIWEQRIFDRRLSACLAALGIAAFILPYPAVLAAASALFALFALRETDPRRTGKKKLVFTPRAQRIFWLALLFWFALQGIALEAGRLLPFAEIVLVQALPLALIASAALLQQFENRVQKKFREEAKAKLRELQPFIIGVTGSYGKTSVKHILSHILQMSAPTLVTPGSVNTEMGIARVVRESLTAQHKYFIVEMGAYGPGSIARLCALAPPDMGIITAVAFAHYERFKSLEAVASTKFELAEAVAAKGGRVIVGAKALGFAAPEKIRREKPDLIIPVSGVLAEHTSGGLRISIPWNGETHSVDTPLFGLHQAENVALAFIAACTLGLPVQTVRTALRSVPQITHRLEVKPGAPTMIDDAYNSNPDGFAAALDLLAHLGKPGGRRILVTPGIVELGALSDEKHAALGGKAAKMADIVIAVLPDRIRPFIDAYRAAGGPELIEAASFAEAERWIGANARPDDVILLENDLPDLYEAPPRF